MHALRLLRLMLLVLGGLLLITTPVFAQSDSDFVVRAIQLAQQSQRETAVPTSITVAQAIWETGYGRSPIGDANNYFGIKAAAQADGSINVGPIAEGWIWAWTKEWDGKRYVDRRERFRKYRSMDDSFRDHGILLATNPRYANAMQAADDPREFARRLAAAGYATSPTYGQDLIRMMDQENLYQHDLKRNAAEFVGQSEYLHVTPGSIFQVYFDLMNSGFATWTPLDDYYLENTNELRFTASRRYDLDFQVPPERVKRWALTMVAPTTPGAYRTAWIMKHRDQAFGPEVIIELHVSPQTDDYALPKLIALLVIGLLLMGGTWRVYKHMTLPPEYPKLGRR